MIVLLGSELNHALTRHKTMKSSNEQIVDIERDMKNSEIYSQRYAKSDRRIDHDFAYR